jgi:alpha-ketoglutarate-dependent 2,4-dichlorophenoxyacetate dioxygenase
MGLKATSIKPGFGAVVSGIELTRPLSEAECGEIRAALDQHALLLFKNQQIDQEQQLAFARIFGPLDVAYISEGLHGAKQESLVEISNVDREGQLWSAADRRRMFLAANALWHTDTSFKKLTTKATILSAQEVPPVGGHTEYADMRAAWADLPASMQQKVDGLVAEHDFFHSRALTGFTDFSDKERLAYPSSPQPLVRAHAATGKKSLYLSSHAHRILGMSQEEGRALLAELTAFATQEKYVYSHRWELGNVVVWDDSCTMHRAGPFDEFKYRRVLYRTGVNETVPNLPDTASAS